MAYSVSQSFVSGQPPLLVFTICLMAFGLTMVVLAYLIGEREVPNPDVHMDWNRFFLKLSDLHMCMHQHDVRQGNEILSPYAEHYTIDLPQPMNSTHNSSMSHIVDESRSMNAALSNVIDHATDDKSDDVTVINLSVEVLFGVRRFNFPNSFSHFKGSIKGIHLGFKGKLSSRIFNFSLSFQPFLNKSCNSGCQSTQHVCLTLDLPSTLLPQTKIPEKCEISSQKSLPVYFAIPDTKDTIPQGACITLDYTPDAKLTEMLSLHDRSIVNLHLMHTSYFMFVMVMTLLCYSLIKGRYRHPKSSYSSEKIPLDA